MFRSSVVTFVGAALLLLLSAAMALSGQPHNDGIYGESNGGTTGTEQAVGAEPYDLPFEVDPLEPVPEPGTLVLVGSGLIVAARLARKRLQ